ncbi:type II secretion system F family protein [Thermococci archaeon]|nr:MAG: type II secretion system F family protein [Thermococci archaeon]
MGLGDKFIHFLEKLGERTMEVSETKVLRRIPERATIQERLILLKQMQKEIEKEKVSKTEKEVEKILEWREKEVQRPLGERLAETLLKYFKGPIEVLTQSIKGLDYDLYRANIKTTKEMFVTQMIITATVLGIFSLIFAILIEMPLDLSIMIGLLGFIGGFLYMRNYPKLTYRGRVAEVERALPYVLRHMGSLLSAGVGITEAMVSVSIADYGPISEEFELIIRDIRSGASFEDALLRFERKMGSESISRVTKQILRAMKFGGNLADILYKLAEDFSFEYRMKLLDYVQKINGFAFIYMFLSVVMPTMFIVAILAASAMAKTLVIPVQGMAVLLLFGVPAISILMVIMIKRREPR